MKHASQEPSAPPTVRELVDDHGRMVHATAYRVLGKAEDAEDVFQDVFLKVSQLLRWGRGRGIRNWGAFLRVLATRRALDVARRNRSRNLVLGSEWIEGLEHPSTPSPRADTLAGERAHLMRQALSTLPRREALVLSLHYFDDLTYAEIASHLDLSPNAVGVLLYRARHRLRAILQPVLWPERPVASLVAALPSVPGDPS